MTSERIAELLAALNREAKDGLCEFTLGDGSIKVGELRALLTAVQKSQRLAALFEQTQGEIIPVLNDEFFRATWVREAVGEAA